MRQWAEKTYWIVGASEGLGRAVAEAVSRTGATVVVSARNEARLKDLVEGLPGPARAEPMDVTDLDDIRAAADRVGPVDGLIYLAGVYWPMSAAKWDAEKAAAMVDVNFTGAVRTLGVTVPAMVARGRGHIVLTGSLTAYRGLPGSIGYTASKAGIMSLAECTYADLRTTGIDVQLINPGFVRTRLTDKNDFSMPFIMEPEDAARKMMDLMNGGQFHNAFPWFFSLVFRGGRFLPGWAYYRLFGGSA